MSKKLLLIILLLLAWLLLIVLFAGQAKGSELDYYLMASTAPYSFQGYPVSTLTQNPFLVATTSVWEGSTDWIKSIIVSKARSQNINPELALEIVRRESNFSPNVCNGKFGCGSGQGLFQIISSTNKHCEKKLGRKLNPFDTEDNIDCGLYLLSQPNGIKNWNPYSGPY